MRESGFRSQGLGSRDWGLEFSVDNMVLACNGFGFRLRRGFRVSGAKGFRVSGAKVDGLPLIGFRV